MRTVIVEAYRAHGTTQAVAKALGTTPRALAARMQRAGLTVTQARVLGARLAESRSLESVPLADHLVLHGMYLSALDAVADREGVIDVLARKLGELAQQCGAHP